MPRGYDRPLYIQPFDHRGSFQTKLFGWQSPLSDAQTAEIAAAKRVIYDGFLAALAAGVPKEKAGILVDEQFGTAILRDAASINVVTACPAEKSGQEEFDFEYGEDFARHIEIFEPTFCKVLVRYNPQGDRALNERQAARLNIVPPMPWPLVTVLALLCFCRSALPLPVSEGSSGAPDTPTWASAWISWAIATAISRL
jgi:myo-inositol catabolism protein IolC